MTSARSVCFARIGLFFAFDRCIEADLDPLGMDGGIFIPNNTYKSVRLLGEGYNLYYSVWCNNEHELYDLSVSFDSRRIWRVY